MLPAALRTGPLLAGVHPVNGHRVALEDVVLGEHLPAALAAEVPLPEVNGQDVALEDVPLGEAPAALAAAVVALLQVHRLDVALQELPPAEDLSALGAPDAPAVDVGRDSLDVIVVVVVDVVVDLLLDDVRVHVQNNLFRHFIGIGRIPETQDTGSCSSFASKGCLS